MGAASASAQQYWNLIVVLALLATVGVILRYLARWQSKRSFGTDDIMIGIALLFTYGMVVNGGFMFLKGGLGEEFHSLTKQQSETFFKTFYASQILYYLCMTPVKLSMLHLYRRLFSTSAFIRASWILEAVCWIWCIGCILPTIFQCAPVPSAWEKGVTHQCIDTGMLFTGITISNLLIDVMIVGLPIGVVWKLQLPLRHRIIVSCLFLSGGLVCVVCLLRIITSKNVTLGDTVVRLRCALWTIAEPELAVFCACLPSLRPLLPSRDRFSQWSSNIPGLKSIRSGKGSLSYTSGSTDVASRGKSWYGYGGLLSDSDRKAPGGIVTMESVSEDSYPLKGYRETTRPRDAIMDRQGRSVGYDMTMQNMADVREGQVKVWNGVNPQNEYRSQKAMERLGLDREGDQGILITSSIEVNEVSRDGSSERESGKPSIGRLAKTLLTVRK